MPIQEYNTRTYILPGDSVHRIRESLQIILDYAEHNDSDVLMRQVHRIMQEIAPKRVSL